MPRPAGDEYVGTPAKLRTPPAPRHEIPRPRVVAAIDRAATAHVVGVYGRAGAGKTTAIAQWARQSAPRAYWYTLDPDSLGSLEQHVAAAASASGSPTTIVVDDVDAPHARDALAAFDA